MEVTLKQFFTLGDGRVSTDIGDVYAMLNYIFDDNLMTHQIPDAMRKIAEVNPDWFSKHVSIIDDIKRTNNTDDFNELMTVIDNSFSTYTVELGKIDYKIGFFSGLENLGADIK